MARRKISEMEIGRIEIAAIDALKDAAFYYSRGSDSFTAFLAAQYVITTLIAYESSGDLLYLSFDKLSFIAAISATPETILLLPAVRVFENKEELA